MGNLRKRIDFEARPPIVVEYYIANKDDAVLSVAESRKEFLRRDYR
jgi:hypothetical protein